MTERRSKFVASFGFLFSRWMAAVMKAYVVGAARKDFCFNR